MCFLIVCLFMVLGDVDKFKIRWVLFRFKWFLGVLIVYIFWYIFILNLMLCNLFLKIILLNGMVCLSIFIVLSL